MRATLLQAVIHSHRIIAPGGDESEYKNRKLIAEILLARGANVHAPAKVTSEGKAPWTIDIGQTPWEMTKTYQNMPFYFHEGIRASYCYTG